MRNMRICVILISLLVDWSAADMCLTGTMTDVQNWVDQEGRLIMEEDIARHVSDSSGILPQGARHHPQHGWRALSDTKPSLSLDISGSSHPVPTLQAELLGPSRTTQRIRSLSMAKCRLREVPDVFSMEDLAKRKLADTLEYLTLYGNQFDDHQSTGDRYDSFLNASNARALSSSLGYDTRGRASASWPSGFLGIKFTILRELDLRACAITTLSANTFEGMRNLEALYLSDNMILFINAKAFTGLQNLTHLDLSRNYDYDEFGNQKSLLLESVDVLEDLENLVSLDFSYTRLSQGNLMMFSNLGKKFQRLSLCETGLVKLRDKFFEKTSLRYLDISGNYGILNHFNELAGIETTLEVLYAARIGLGTLEIFAGFKRLEILNVQSNEIHMLPIEIAKSFDNLLVLDLDKNRLKTWFFPVFSHIPKLKYLSVRSNNINMINEVMIKDFKTVNYVGISGNQLICNCHSRELFELALRAELDESYNNMEIMTTYTNNGDAFSSFHNGFSEYNNIIAKRKNISQSCDADNYCDDEIYGNSTDGSFLLFDYDPLTYQCMQTAEGKQVSYSNVISCNQARSDIDYEEAIIEGWNKLLALWMIPLIAFPIMIFVYMFRKNFRYFCITIRNSALLTMINKDKVIDETQIFNYDVFVSYCNDDRFWILDQLLPHMETTCGVSVCLHERDFQVGLSILENIVSCMDRSRTIMLILSKQFLMSQWCQFEMHLAQHRLLETRREDLILVLLEDIPRRLRPTTLHYLMLTKTYIVYPTDGGESARKEFWKRLGRSVTARRPEHENDSLA